MAWLTVPAGEDTASAICAIQYKIKKKMLNKEGKTLMTHFLIREKQPNFDNIEEGAGHLQGRTVSAVILHL